MKQTSDAKTKYNNLPLYLLLGTIVFILIGISIIYFIHISNVYELNKQIIDKGGINLINTNDTFTGTALTIICILVTFVIGYQIYNAVELKKYIEEKVNAFQALNDELVKIKKDNEKSLLELSFNASYERYKLRKKERNCYDKALNELLCCIKQRIKFEKYIPIPKNIVNKYSGISTINYCKLSAYEFELLDFCCNYFFNHLIVTDNTNKVRFENSIIIKEIFDYHKDEIKNETFDFIYKIIIKYEEQITECEKEYSYDNSDIKKIFEYRNHFLETYKDDIAFIKNTEKIEKNRKPPFELCYNKKN